MSMSIALYILYNRQLYHCITRTHEELSLLLLLQLLLLLLL